MLDAAREVKKERLEGERELEALKRQRDQVVRDVNLTVKLTEHWRGIHRSVVSAQSLDEKRGWLADLQVKVSAMPGEYEAKCFMDADWGGGDKRFDMECEVQEKASRLMRERPELFGDAVLSKKGLAVAQFNLEQGVELRDYFTAEEFSELLSRKVVPQQRAERESANLQNLVTIEQTSGSLVHK